MTPDQFKTYLEVFRNHNGPLLHASQVGTDPRLLCVGYTVDRHHFEVEMIDGEFEVRVNGETIARGEALSPQLLRPSKRAHPERTDLRFAVAMLQSGEPLTFASWREGTPLFEGSGS